MELRTLALQALAEADIDRKLAQVRQLHARFDALPISAGELPEPPPLPARPGRPDRPRLLDPTRVPRRNVNTAEGRAALVHAICHIEFNAINLGLDAVWRFAGMPRRFYGDWLRVAAEEVEHFSLLHAHLQAQGWRYGDFDAHDGLWAMCEKTRHDITARMALVPRTLEARGLDATPQIQTRLRAVGTPDALAVCGILDIILRDEVGHVAIGNHWYGLLCQQQGLHPLRHYAKLLRQYCAPRLRGPFNLAARAQAGFTPDELHALQWPDAQDTDDAQAGGDVQGNAANASQPPATAQAG